jgi:hypothetical protein
MLLSDLARRGVALRVEGEKLRWTAPAPDVVTSAKATLIRVHKAAIIQLLRRTAEWTEAPVKPDAPRSCEADDRRALYDYANRMGFPRVALATAGKTVGAGEACWRRFAQQGSQWELWEAAIEMIDVEDAGRARS